MASGFGVVDGGVGGQRDELALHDAAGGLLVVPQQVADVGGEPRWNCLEEALDLLPWQLGEEVGRVIRLERGQYATEAGLRQGVEERLAGLVAEQAQHGGGARGLEMGEEARAQVVVLDRVEQLGGVGRVQAPH